MFLNQGAVIVEDHTQLKNYLSNREIIMEIINSVYMERISFNIEVLEEILDTARNSPI